MENGNKDTGEFIKDDDGSTDNVDGRDKDVPDHQVDSVNVSKRISFPYQILLSLIFFASQLSIGFYSIYGLLSLQYFGLPTYLISSTGFISGLLSLTIIPIVGAYSDRGPRPKFRKAMVQVAGLFILLMAYTLMASSAAISSKDVIEDPMGGNLSRQLNESRDTYESLPSEQNCSVGEIDIANKESPRCNSSLLTSIESTGITIAGVLGVIGLSSIDVSYDMTMSLTKGLLVECVPPRQKTQILNTSTIIGGIGSCIMSCVGMLDLPHYLGKRFNTDGMALALILVCSCFSAVSILLFGTSIRAALHLYHKERAAKLNNRDEKTPLKGDNIIEEGSMKYAHEMETVKDENLFSDNHTHENNIIGKDEQSVSDLLELSGAGPSTEINQPNTLLTDKIHKESKKGKGMCSSYPRNKHFVLAIFSAFINVGIVLTGVMYSSHTLTIEVYKGDPLATPGTPPRDKYEEGIRMASVGFLISSAVFVPTSIANTKLLKYIDHHTLFAFSTVIVGVCFLVYYLTRDVTTFLISMGAFGFYRCMGTIIPYTTALKYASRKKKVTSGEDNSVEETERPVGAITSLVGTMVPLHFLVLTFMGPAMELFGSGWLPMLYIIGLSCLNAAINIILKFL